MMSLLSVIYPAHKGRALSARACGSSLGMTLGAVIGGGLGQMLGYFGVFTAFAIISLLTPFLFLLFKEARDSNVARGATTQLTLVKLLSVRRPLLNLLTNTICEFLYMALEPTLAIKLRTDFELSTSQIGLFFFLFCGGEAITMGAMVFLPEEWDKRKLVCPAMVLMALFSFLVGPSLLLGFTNSPTLIMVGLLVGGGCRGICFALCPTDAIVGALEVYPQEETKVADLVSSAYNALYGVGTLIFPIIGSALVRKLGFRRAFDVISIVLLVTSCLYLVSTVLDWRKEKRERGD